MSRNEILFFLHTAHFLDHLFLLLFPTVAIAIGAEWGLTYGEALALGTPIYFTFALGTLPAGWLGDRIDRTTLIVVFFLGSGVSSLLIALSIGPRSLMVGLGFLGLFAALYHPVGLALVTEVASRPGRALAINGVFGNLGLAGAAVVAGFLTDHGGWQSAFLVPGLISLVVGGVLFLRRRRSTTVPINQVSNSFETEVLTNQRIQATVFIIVCVSALFGGLVFNAITVSLPKFFDERLIMLEGNLTWIGASAAAVFTVAAFAQLPVGELLDRFGARPILISLLVVQIFLLLSLAHARGWWAIGLALLLVTIIFAEIPITSWLLGRYVCSGVRSRALSVEYILSLGVGSTIVPLIAGLHHIGMGFDIQFQGLAIAASVILVAALWLPQMRDTRDGSARIAQVLKTQS